MKAASSVVICASLLTATGSASAAQVATSFSALGGSDWQLTLSLGNDGSVASVTGFTAYFSEFLFANVVLVTSPSAWDSIVIQPDRALSSAGFLDAFIKAPRSGLGASQTQSGFVVRLTYLGTGAPPSLPFEVVSRSFQPLAAGHSAAAISVIPETGTAVLLALGLSALAGLGHRRSRANDRRRSAGATEMAAAGHA